MPERIPELDQFLTRAKETPMLPASEVRRRGDRRRRIRHTGITAGALALTLIAGFGIAQTPLLDNFRTQRDAVPLPADPEESPTPSPAAPDVTAPTWENVPVADEVIHPQVEGEVRDEYEGVGQAARSFCDPGEYGEYATALTREYGAVGFGTSISATVFGYPSPEAALEGLDLLERAALDCSTVYEENNYTRVRIDDQSDNLPYDPPADSTAQVAYVTAVGNSPATPEVGTWTEMMILQVDERVLYVTQQFDGMDNNCSVTPEGDMEQCVLAANSADMLNRLIA